MDKHKLHKRTGGGVEDRVYRHYKSLKRYAEPKFTTIKVCGWLNDCRSRDPYGQFGGGFFPHRHGFWGPSTPNSDWLRLARTHKMSVREVKDIVSKRRNWRPNVREQIIFD